MNIEGKGKKRVPVPVPVGRAVWGNTVDRERGKPGNLKMRIFLFYFIYFLKKKEKKKKEKLKPLVETSQTVCITLIATIME